MTEHHKQGNLFFKKYLVKAHSSRVWVHDHNGGGVAADRQGTGAVAKRPHTERTGTKQREKVLMKTACAFES